MNKKRYRFRHLWFLCIVEVKTTNDGLKLVPFSFFFIIPFAELALPFVLKIFPNLLPYDDRPFQCDDDRPLQ